MRILRKLIDGQLGGVHRHRVGEFMCFSELHAKKEKRKNLWALPLIWQWVRIATGIGCMQLSVHDVGRLILI